MDPITKSPFIILFIYYKGKLHLSLIKLFETNLIGVLSETSTTHVKSVFTYQTMMVAANTTTK